MAFRSLLAVAALSAAFSAGASGAPLRLQCNFVKSERPPEQLQVDTTARTVDNLTEGGVFHLPKLDRRRMQWDTTSQAPQGPADLHYALDLKKLTLSVTGLIHWMPWNDRILVSEHALCVKAANPL
jgi:hypothetical protein